MLAEHEQRSGGWTHRPRTMLTIHNLAYQGTFPANAFQLTNLPPAMFNHHTVEFYGAMNCLKAGIATADVVTTVSPRYAREIMTEEFGCGLDGLLRARNRVLHGVLNGVDYDEWNPETDPHIASTYSAGTVFEKKPLCKADLQKAMKLPESPTAPVLGLVARVHGLRIVPLLRHLKDELLIVLGLFGERILTFIWLPRMVSNF